MLNLFHISVNSAKRMKRVVFYLAALILLGSCGGSGNGELIGVQDRKPYYQPMPFGMAYIPLGSYTMGVGDEDEAYAMIHQPKTVTVTAFYMDETEITNNEYRQFVYWVRDSIARVLLGDILPEDYLIEEDEKTGEIFDPPFLNWQSRIDWEGEEEREVLSELYLSENERFFRKKELDTRKLNYEYYWVDLLAASKKDFSKEGNQQAGSLANRPQGLQDRSVYVRKETINVYPDTLVWLFDYSYSFNEPLTQKYFWHPAYDNYPVVGVNWRQAKAFCVWRTQLKNTFMAQKSGEASLHDYRLPTEAEWEWAARGGLTDNIYPWGNEPVNSGQAKTNSWDGTFPSDNNQKDGYYYTAPVKSFKPNGYGLYNMAGNVWEWCSDWYRADYYEIIARPDGIINPQGPSDSYDPDEPFAKKKTIRGGSFLCNDGYCSGYRVARRMKTTPDSGMEHLGFRCVK